jgi:uncharacterized membrane protein
MKMGLTDKLILCGITAAIFLIIDLIWIGLVAKDFYARQLGGLLRERVNWSAALAFYCIYVGGIVFFVVLPALQSGAGGGSGIWRAAWTGALLGLFAYSTFDLTAQALLRGWPSLVTAVDMLWGTLLTGTTAAATLWIIHTFLKPHWTSG